MKNETIEEAAERLAKDHCNNRINTNTTEFQVQQLIIKGAKWQQKRMYSEKDMINFNEWAENSEESANFWKKNKRSPTMDASYNIFMYEKKVELFEIWKKQFKK